jgi:integrase
MRRTERAAYRTKFYSNLSSPTRFDEKPNLEDIMYRVGHKDSKMTRQVYNYFYPEREERSADQFAQFIEKEKYLF